jgi:hypothetical protein
MELPYLKLVLLLLRSLTPEMNKSQIIIRASSATRQAEVCAIKLFVTVNKNVAQ